MAQPPPPRACEALRPRWGSRGRPGPLSTGFLGTAWLGDLGLPTQGPGCWASEAELGRPMALRPHRLPLGSWRRFLFFSERGRRWPAPRDPGGAASWEGASGVGREGLDKGPVKAFSAGMPGLVARRRSRGEALPSSLCHPPSHGAAIVEVALPWLGSCRPLPQGCQMGSARGSQVWALAPAPSPPMGPGGARRRAKQASGW